jgi:hypothetical protein
VLCPVHDDGGGDGGVHSGTCACSFILLYRMAVVPIPPCVVVVIAILLQPCHVLCRRFGHSLWWVRGLLRT